MDAELQDIRRLVRALHEAHGLPWIRIAELVELELNNAVWDIRLDECIGKARTVVYPKATNR